MKNFLQTITDLFQRYIELDYPLFSLYEKVLDIPYLNWIVFGLSAVIGLAVVYYRSMQFTRGYEGYYSDSGFILTLYGVGSAVATLAAVMFFVPVLYVMGLGLLLHFLKCLYVAGWPIVQHTKWMLTWHLFVFGCIGYFAWFMVTNWVAIITNWDIGNSVLVVVCWLYASVMFGLVRHELFADKSKFVSSSHLGTTFRYLHLNFAWGVWEFVYNFMIDISTSHTLSYTVDQLALANGQHLIAMEKEDNKYISLAARVMADRDKIELLNGTLKEREGELYALRDKNGALRKKVNQFSRAFVTLKEQNEQLRKQWTDSLKRDEPSAADVVDLAAMIPDEE